MHLTWNVRAMLCEVEFLQNVCKLWTLIFVKCSWAVTWSMYPIFANISRTKKNMSQLFRLISRIQFARFIFSLHFSIVASQFVWIFSRSKKHSRFAELCVWFLMLISRMVCIRTDQWVWIYQMRAQSVKRAHIPNRTCVLSERYSKWHWFLRN